MGQTIFGDQTVAFDPAWLKFGAHRCFAATESDLNCNNKRLVGNSSEPVISVIWIPKIFYTW